jgi:hypothetical protein
MSARLEAAPPDGPRLRYVRGRKSPRAIAWFGFSAFWGHLRHLIASAIATENIDSRQWMVPDEPRDLLAKSLAVLGAPIDAPTLAEGLGGEVWIDFVADTGDDVEVSEAVARVLAAPYVIADPDDLERDLELPRGDVLFLGGDLAYPVATVREIARRLVDPWNVVFRERADGRTRLLLAIPGNHDWYDGLDGFARLCQAPCDFEGERASREDRRSSLVLEHPVLAWAEAFSRGVAVVKPGALAFEGHVPVQRASYFRLPLAQGLELFAVDRQLKLVDPRQQAYFARSRPPALLVVVPDPVRAWGEMRPHGVATQASLSLEPTKDPALILSGDVHHYERSREGPSLHVVAGGGGAFLHGARVAGGAAYTIDAEFPGPKASWTLLKRLWWITATGGAGWLVVFAFAIVQALGLWQYLAHGLAGGVPFAIGESLAVAVATALLVGWRDRRAYLVLPFALALGAFIGAIPLAIGIVVEHVGTDLFGAGALSRVLTLSLAWLAATTSSNMAFGAMLTLIARLGLNHAQPFAAMGAPCHRHFVRMRVRADGCVDGFVIGVVDPVGAPKPVLVDTFRWWPQEVR